MEIYTFVFGNLCLVMLFNFEEMYFSLLIIHNRYLTYKFVISYLFNLIIIYSYLYSNLYDNSHYH